MWSWIVEDKEYLELYHQLMNEFINSYFESGFYEEEIQSTYQMIHSYIEKDPTAFYSDTRVDKGYQFLLKFCTYRSQSIRKQLDGSLEKITNSQTKENQIKATDITITGNTL